MTPTPSPRRTKARGALLTAAALALTACSGGSGASTQSEESLTWSMWISGQEDQAAWQTVADEVRSADGIDVTIQGAPFNDYWTKLRTQLSTGNAPCIVTVQSLRAANFTDVLLPLDDLVAEAGLDLEEFDSTALEAMKVDGDLYALPYDTGPVMMFYNRTMFADAGIDEPEPGWSVSDFEAAGAEFAEQGETLFATTVEDLFLESVVLAYNGGRVVTEDGTLAVTDSKFAEGFDWLSGLVRAGYASQAAADGTADENAFINGQVATYVDGPWALIYNKGTADFELGVVTLPAGGEATTFSAGSGFGISEECAYPDEAFAAIQTMTSESVLSTLGTQGRAFPSRVAAQQAWFDNADIDGVDTAFAAAQSGSVPLPGNPASDQLAQLFAQYGIEAINGQSSGEAVLSQISSQLPQ